MARPEQIAVAIAGSQKTLAVGLQVCMELGFNIVPVVAFHITQLLVDTLIAGPTAAALRPDSEPRGRARGALSAGRELRAPCWSRRRCYTAGFSKIRQTHPKSIRCGNLRK